MNAECPVPTVIANKAEDLCIFSPRQNAEFLRFAQDDNLE